jgi:nucleoside-diphosphate-sugar epimerase
MTMKVVVTGGAGVMGQSIVEYGSSEFDYVFLDRENMGLDNSYQVDARNKSTLKDHFDEAHSVIHLAADSNKNASWESLMKDNFDATKICLEAASESSVKKFILASSNRVLGGYEKQKAPDIYKKDSSFRLDESSPVRPDSLYAVSKVAAEATARHYMDYFGHPKQVFVLRIGSVRPPGYDHPLGDAKKGVEEDMWTPNSLEYKRSVQRMMCLWLSRKDSVTLVEKCLENEGVDFGIFFGVSNNKRCWFSMENTKKMLNYEAEESADSYADKISCV